MTYTLEPTDDFMGGLEQLDKTLKERVKKILEKLKETPRQTHSLRGNWTYHRERFEGHRLIYTVVEHEKKVVLVDVGKRDVIYRKYRVD